VGTPDEAGRFTRECHDKSGKCWIEKIRLDQLGMRLNAEFDTQRPGFPFPFEQMHGGWQIDPSQGGATVKVWWSMIPKRRMFAFFILPIIDVLIRRSFKDTLANVRNAASGEQLNGQHARRAHRLKMAVC